MWKFLRSKSIWVALSGCMLALGTLFTAVDDAKAFSLYTDTQYVDTIR